MAIKHISSKDNAIYKRLRLALKDNNAYRADNLVWIEGESLANLCIGLNMPTKCYPYLNR